MNGKSSPPGVPAGAVWNEDRHLWELETVDEAGARRGDFASFRADGSPYLRCRYEGGVQEGAFEILHPNGQVARRGRYVKGELDGLVEHFASDAETPERLRGCCVPPGAWQMQARWSEGQLQREIFLDRENRPLLGNGKLRPPRPPGLLESAEYDEFDGRWSVAVLREGTEATWRHYTQEGTLDEETRYKDGRRLTTQRFAPDGSLRFEAAYDDAEKPHGPWRRRFLLERDGVNPYVDVGVVEERGTYRHGETVGRWELRDGRGGLVRAVERGGVVDAALDALVALPVLQDEARTATGWRQLAHELRAPDVGRVRESLLAAARASACAADVSFLRETLAETVLPLSAAESGRLAEAATGADEDDTAKRLSAIMSALVNGGDAPALLRALASTLGGAPRASLDFVEASILLAPDRPMTYLTRALTRAELGDPEGALADGARVAAASEEAATFVRRYVAVLYPAWAFSPARESTPTFDASEMPDAPGQPLSRIREVFATYATRLARLRAALVKSVGMVAWLPPDLSALLPDGPIALGMRTATITDETEDGPETVEVKIDESLEIGDGAPVTTLLRAARAQWAALSWLCWSVGLDRIGLPEEVTAPPAFGAAIGQTLHRYFRARDVLETNGLRSLSSGVPGFVWEDMDIDVAPRPLVEMAVTELFEMRAMFLWLASPENISPWQSDLREV